MCKRDGDCSQTARVRFTLGDGGERVRERVREDREEDERESEREREKKCRAQACARFEAVRRDSYRGISHSYYTDQAHTTHSDPLHPVSICNTTEEMRDYCMHASVNAVGKMLLVLAIAIMMVHISFSCPPSPSLILCSLDHFILTNARLKIGDARAACPTASTKWSKWSKAPTAANQELGITTTLQLHQYSETPNIYHIILLSLPYHNITSNYTTQ